MKVWVIIKDDQSYGQDLIEIHISKESAKKRVEYLNNHKSKIDAVTGDFYVIGYHVHNKEEVRP